MRSPIVETTRRLFVQGDDDKLLDHLRQPEIFAHLAEHDPKLLFRCCDELRGEYTLEQEFQGLSADIDRTGLSPAQKTIANARAGEIFEALAALSAPDLKLSR
jgi:hypothetical protein